MIHPNGHNDNGNAAVIQEPAGGETLSNVPLPPDATAPMPGPATRAKQRARQQIQQNRFVIVNIDKQTFLLQEFVQTGFRCELRVSSSRSLRSATLSSCAD